MYKRMQINNSDPFKYQDLYFNMTRIFNITIVLA